METAQETARPLTDECATDAEVRLREAQQKVAALNDRALTFIRERPITCVVGALALGFIVGKLAARC